MFVNVANVVIIVLLNHEKDLGQKEVMRVKKICQMPDGSFEKRLLNLKQNFKSKSQQINKSTQIISRDCKGYPVSCHPHFMP